jgi:DNA-binding XRE family transcriptional regulator
MTLSLKQARLIREKSQRDIADILGVHVQTYRKLEENPNLTTVEQAKKISAYLKVPYDEIFFAS